MKIYNQTETISPNIMNFKSRKIPRYIYHLTNDKNYESMLKDGFIRTSEDDNYVSGVFAIELSNFLKRWRSNNDWAAEASSLQDKLLRHVSGWNHKLVALKIPTDLLDKSKLCIRSQNQLFNKRKLKTKNHLYAETPAEQAKLFKRRREAIEYIYDDDIPISSVEKIGEVSVRDLKKSAQFDSKKPILSILTTLFAGKPECKAAELLDC